MPLLSPNRTATIPEKWLLRHGLLRLLDGTGIESRVSVRAAPPLILIFLVLMLWGVPTLFALPTAVGFAISVVTIVVTWLLANLQRRRPIFAPLQRIGWFEAAAFVFVPTVAVAFAPGEAVAIDSSLTLDPDETKALALVTVFLMQLTILALVFLIVVSGLVPLTGLLARQIVRAMPDTGSSLGATLPVVLGLVFFFFLNPGVWLAVANLDGLSYVLLIGFLIGLAGLFLGSRRQFDLAALTRFDTQAQLTDALSAGPLADYSGVEAPVSCPLERRQWRSLRRVATLSRLVSPALVGVSIFAAFVMLGFIVVGTEAVTSWTRKPAGVIVSVTAFGTQHFVSTQHLRVAGFLAAFSSLNYALVSATDTRLRRDAADAASDVVRRACALRLVLLASARQAPSTDEP